jgi:peptidoglycan/xylan/chitin deacetylase (PgdA/CDA1 family)
MKIMKRKSRQKFIKTLVSFAILVIFLAPGLLTTKWAYSVVAAKDPRRVTEVLPSQTRDADKTAKPLNPFNEPIITVSFDDGWESVYTDGLPSLQKYGVHTTQYIISGVFDNPSYMSVKQLKSIQQSGHEIAGHTIDHPDLTQLDDKALTTELVGSRDVLSRYFGPIHDFTSPYGAYNAHTLELISKYYRSQKNAEGDPAANELEAINVKSTFDPMNIKSYSVRQSTTPYDLTKLMKAAKDNNGWLILTYHQIDNSGTEFSTSPQEFESQMALLFNSPIRSATVGQVMDVWQSAKAQR